MIEDVEIALCFSRAQFDSGPALFVTGTGNGYALASAASETLVDTKLLARPDANGLNWSDLVEQKRELWPVQFLVPGGAYIH